MDSFHLRFHSLSLSDEIVILKLDWNCKAVSTTVFMARSKGNFVQRNSLLVSNTPNS